jgi:SAM-dependent methyltransferase
MAVVSRCRVCDGPQQEWFVKQGRRLLRCPRCLLVTVPAGVVLADDGLSIYESNHNIFGQDGNDVYYLDETNLRSCHLKLNWVRRYLPPGARLIDAGANYGHFLKVAQDVYDAAGFDLSPQAVAWSRQHFQVNNRVASIYQPPELGGPADGVACWDVIEHLAEPLAALEQIHRLLRLGGYVFLSSPDTGSLAARCLGKFWYYLDPVQHINLFSLRGLKRALAQTGFEVVSTCSFGRYYRLRYVTDRVLQLYKSGPLRHGAAAAVALLRPFLGRALYLKLGDVMGVAARKRVPAACAAGHGGRLAAAG